MLITTDWLIKLGFEEEQKDKVYIYSFDKYTLVYHAKKAREFVLYFEDPVNTNPTHKVEIAAEHVEQFIADNT